MVSHCFNEYRQLETTATPKTYPKTYPTSTATTSFTTPRNESKPNNVSSDSLVWLGGNDQLQEGEWIWTDGTKANLTSLWHEYEPNNSEGNEDCLELYEHGMLNDDNCAKSLSFICMELHEKTGNPEMSPSTTKTLPLTINTFPLTNATTTLTTETTPSTTPTTTLTTETTPSTTPTTAAIEVKNNNNVSKTGNVSNNTQELNSSRPTVINAENENDKFKQTQKVAFTVGLSKPLDVLLKDVVVYNKVVSNVGDDYNSSTGVFRCNVAGLYFFQIYGAANKGKELSLSLVKNKTKVVSLYSNTNQELSLAANSAVLLLEAGDEVFVEASICGSLYGEEHHVINTFSGFLLDKLVFGHSVRGPLKQIQKRWQEPESIQWRTDAFHDRLKAVCELAHKNLRNAQEIMKERYDKITQNQTFNPGEEVLVLMPTINNALSLRYYKVILPVLTSDITDAIETSNRPIEAYPRPRWNYKKANWELFSSLTDSYTRPINCKTKQVNKSYTAFSKAVLLAAKKSIPRGARKNYIPNWTPDLQILHDETIDARNIVEENPTENPGTKSIAIAQ
ncbi:uncharacterized protein LOC131949939 [Physella acuta]|uniref:uncharacterized protein LOC131949939 n=1 Tax=Physella acuta TaxID=109671 RepID=UPI0027DD7412|nr:uncharacterized protein LOC131949939 [Physella acuta]